MRLKPGKICNSLKSISPTACLQRLCSCCCICASRSSMSSNSSGTNKPTLKKELKLIYYTFLYNHHNDSLTALETVLYPFVDMMTSFVKILGWVFNWDRLKSILRLLFLFALFSLVSRFICLGASPQYALRFPRDYPTKDLSYHEWLDISRAFPFRCVAWF